jgi:CheY-like chemotaxis protein
MLLNWWRKRAGQANRGYFPSQRRRLAFERLEERCVPSAKPVSSAATPLLIPEPIADPLPTLAVSVDDGQLRVTPPTPSAAYDDAWFACACQTEPAQIPDDALQQALTGDNTDLLSPPLGQGSQKACAQNDDNALNAPGSPNQGGGREGKATGVDDGDFSAVQVCSGLSESIPSSGKNQSIGLDIGSGPVSSRIADFETKFGVLSSQARNYEGQKVPGDQKLTSSRTLVSVNRQSADANLGREVDPSPAWRQEAEPDAAHAMVIRWLADPRVTDASAVQHSSLNGTGSAAALERLPNGGIVGTEHTSAGQAHAAGVAKEAVFETSEILPAPDTRFIEKPANETSTLGNPRWIAPTAELLRRRETSSFAIKSAMSDAARLQDPSSPAPGQCENLAERPARPAPSRPLGADSLPSSPASATFVGFAFFQCDVAGVGPGTADASALGNTGTTAIDLTSNQSSIWTILTTYALVIVPRQRKYQATILVVDPDDATRDALSVVLVRAGYFVLPAANVRDAWGVFRTPNAQIDLVLLDPNLPDVSGIHLCARLREISPTLPVMVCAREVEPAEAAQLEQLGVQYYLRKPIAFEELLHTVKAILP